MKQGILLVSYGASNAIGAATLRVFQAEVEEKTGLPVRWAFTSESLRRRLAHARTKSDSVLKALNRMHFERYTHIGIQSLHLIAGLEYEDVLEDVNLASQTTHMSLTVGKPLLDDQKGVEECATALLSHLPPDRQPCDVVVCMAHGSPHPAQAQYRQLADLVYAMDPKVQIACMKGERTLDETIPELKALGPSKIWLLPLLSIIGKHSLEDMAGDGPDSWKTRLRQAGFVCEPDLRGLVDGLAFRNLWMLRLQDALDAL